MASDDYYVVKREKENPLKTYIKRRVTIKNGNFLAFISGQTGSGKTYAALRLGEMLDPEFSMRNVVFDFDTLLDRIRDNYFKNKKYKVIIFEEAQESLSSSNWQGKDNQEFNRVLSSFRKMNFIVIFTSPRRNLVNYYTWR